MKTELFITRNRSVQHTCQNGYVLPGFQFQDVAIELGKSSLSSPLKHEVHVTHGTNIPGSFSNLVNSVKGGIDQMSWAHFFLNQEHYSSKPKLDKKYCPTYNEIITDLQTRNGALGFIHFEVER